MQKTALLSYFATAAATAVARAPPSICMQSPLATVTAGQTIFATIENPQGRPCVATLVFSDNNFLPVTFDLQPMMCLGFQQAEISIPLESPDGGVTILWECAGGGAQSCSRASIEGGLANVKELDRQQTGTVACVVPTATLTTLSTSVQDSTTIVNAVVETVFSTSISTASTTLTDLTITTKTSTLEDGMVTTITTALVTADNVESNTLETASMSWSTTSSTSSLSSPTPTTEDRTDLPSTTSMSTTSTAIVGAKDLTGKTADESRTMTTMVMTMPVNTESQCSCSQAPESTADNGGPFN